MPLENPDTCFEFDGYRVDAGRRRLSRTDDGLVIALPPRVFDTLLALLRKPGQLIGKTELRDMVWPRGGVETNSVDQNISLLRRALGDQRRGASFIATVAGRGYQFVAPVRARASSVPPETPGTRSHAMQLYEQAKALVLHPTPDNLRGAISRLRQLVERDEGSGRAWSLLAHAYGTALNYDYPVDGALDHAAHAARNALRIDGDDGGAHAALALVHAMRGDWLESDRCFRTAMAMPCDPYIGSLRCLYLSMSAGHLQSALDEALQANRLGLAQPYGSCMLALTQAAIGMDDEARRSADRTCALGFSADQAPIADLYAQLAMRRGEFDSALAILLAALTPPELAAGGGKALTAMCHALGGGEPVAGAVPCLRAFESALGPAALNAVPRRRLAFWYALLGADDMAYDIIGRALDRDAVRGSVGSAWGFLWIPEMARFRRHGRFSELAGRLKLPPYWEARGGPQVP
jgi:DNA-binding winged helix-turn-helix (wHTH) protein